MGILNGDPELRPQNGDPKMQTPKWEPQMGTPKWGPQNAGTPNGDPILRPQNGVVLLAQQIQQLLKIGGGDPKSRGV